MASKAETSDRSKRDFLVIVLVVLLAFLVYYLARNHDRHGWREIRVEASYDRNDRMTIDTDTHDIGVSGPKDEVSWTLKCKRCPKGTQWQITDLQLVADLNVLTDAVIEMSRSSKLAFKLDRDDLGLAPSTRGKNAAAEVFDLVEPGWQMWASVDESIVAKSKRSKNDRADELWKFAVEIRAPGFDESLTCDADPMRACWDPHKYTHPAF